jgi:bacillolysin
VLPDVDTTYTTSGRYNIWGDNAGVDFLEGGFDPKDADFSIAMSKSVAVPAGAFMRFNHAYGFEDFVVPNITEMYMDGGVVEYSINNGTTWTDAKALFANNGYNGKIPGDSP